MRRGPPHTPPRAARGPQQLSLRPLISAAATGSPQAIGEALQGIAAANWAADRAGGVFILDLRSDHVVEVLAALTTAARLCPERHPEVALVMGGLARAWTVHLRLRALERPAKGLPS